MYLTPNQFISYFKTLFSSNCIKKIQQKKHSGNCPSTRTILDICKLIACKCCLTSSYTKHPFDSKGRAASCNSLGPISDSICRFHLQIRQEQNAPTKLMEEITTLSPDLSLNRSVSFATSPTKFSIHGTTFTNDVLANSLKLFYVNSLKT